EAVLDNARNDLRGQAAGLFALVLAPHAVRDQIQLVAGIGHEAIFVVGPDALGTVGTDTDDKFRHEGRSTGSGAGKSSAYSSFIVPPFRLSNQKAITPNKMN